MMIFSSFCDSILTSATSFTSSNTNFDSSTSASSSRSLDLGDHPLPSPVLHDLHSWMDASTSSSVHPWDTSQISASSVTTDSRQNFSTVINHQGTFPIGQNGADREYASSSPTVLTSPPHRHRRYMRMSYLEGNRREWLQLQGLNQIQIHFLLAFPPLSFNRRSADEVAMRSLDQGFNFRLSSCKYLSYPL